MENTSLQRTRIIVLLFVCAGLTWLITRHSFFSLTDISIHGLDSYASAIVQDVLRNRAQNYFLFPTSLARHEISRRLVLDELHIKKKFPHTVIVSAHEITPIAVMTTRASWGTISADGVVLRQLDSTAAEMLPIPRIDTDLTQQLIPNDVPITSEAVRNALMVFLQKARRIEQNDLRHILLTLHTSGPLYLTYSGGVKVTMTLEADLMPQIVKIRAAMRAYPRARAIDVRFGDKAFVDLQEYKASHIIPSTTQDNQNPQDVLQ